VLTSTGCSSSDGPEPPRTDVNRAVTRAATFGGPGGSAMSSQAWTWTQRMMTPSERAQLAALKPQGLPIALAESPTARVVADAAARDPSSAMRIVAQLGAWQWGWQPKTISHGQIYSGVLNQAFRQHRYVFTWFGDDTDNLADIDVYAYYRCGNAPRYLITYQNDYDVRNRIHVKEGTVPPGCSYEIEVVGYNIPEGQTRTLWEAWLWHNENPD
jgi:hypothetical protein